MSKKKNTLKDLNDFLKQQAATLVSPPRLNEQPQPEAENEPQHIAEKEPEQPEVTMETIFAGLTQLSKKDSIQFRKKFYDLIIRSMEAQAKSLPEDKMLINTALYLKNPNNWKETIREYWRNKED
jgi:hypothetical protein